jgi:hypothetical protein
MEPVREAIAATAEISDDMPEVQSEVAELSLEGTGNGTPELASKVIPEERNEEDLECPDLVTQNDEDSDLESEDDNDTVDDKEGQPVRHNESIKAGVTRPCTGNGETERGQQ